MSDILTSSTVTVGDPRGNSLLTVYRASLDALIEEMWHERLCLLLRSEVEPIVNTLLATGDYNEAKESLDSFFESVIWDDEDFARRSRRLIREWIWQIREAWVRLNVAERKELERRTA